MAAPFPLGLSLLEVDDERNAVLQEVDAAALCQLKAASAAWCTHARRELCTRLCRYEGASITDLDVECLNNAGRLWEVVIAGRQLPQLARLRGYGFVVDVQAVREADLGGDGWAPAPEQLDSPPGGTALRSCIQGEGDPPRELLLAAVACAASGTVRRVPVQRLREDEAIGSLNLDHARLGPIGAALLGLMLPAVTSVRSLSLTRSQLGPEGGAAIAEGLKGNSTLQSLNLANNQLCGLENRGRGTYTTEGITKLCEALKGSAMTSLNVAYNNITGDAAENLAAVVLEHASMTNFCLIPLVALRENSITELDLESHGVGVPGAIVLSKLLPSAVALKWLKIGINNIGNEGAVALAAVLKETKITTLGIACNGIGAEGASALAAVLKETQITDLNLRNNSLGHKGAAALAEGLKGNSTLQLLDVDGHALQIDELKGTKPTEKIKLSRNGLDVASAIIIASCIKGNGVLKELNLFGNGLIDQATKQVLLDASRSGVTIHF